MEKHIIHLILTDVKRALFVHLSREYLDIHTGSLGTDHVLSILHFMGIEPDDRVIDRYFELVGAVAYMTDKQEIDELPKTIYRFLLACPKTQVA